MLRGFEANLEVYNGSFKVIEDTVEYQRAFLRFSRISEKFSRFSLLSRDFKRILENFNGTFEPFLEVG